MDPMGHDREICLLPSTLEISVERKNRLKLRIMGENKCKHQG